MTTSLCALQLVKMSVIQNDTWIWGELLYVVKIVVGAYWCKMNYWNNCLGPKYLKTRSENEEYADYKS